MDEVDALLLLSLKPYLSPPVESIADLQDSTLLLRVIGDLLSAITNDQSYLPTGTSISAKYKTIAKSAEKIKELGYNQEIGLNSFLHPSLRDLRIILGFLLTQIPKGESKEEILEDSSENPFRNKLKSSIQNWVNKEWAPPFDPVLRVQFQDLVPLLDVQSLPIELVAAWEEHLFNRITMRASLCRSSPCAALANEVHSAQLTVTREPLFVHKPKIQIAQDSARLPGLLETLERKRGTANEDVSGLFVLEDDSKQLQEMVDEPAGSSEINEVLQLEEELRIVTEESEAVESLYTAAQAGLSKLLQEAQGLTEENEELKRELDRKYRLATALSEGSPESLLREIDELKQRLEENSQEWERLRSPLLSEAQDQQVKVERAKEKYSDNTEEIRLMKADIREMIEEAEFKEDLYEMLLEEETKGTSSVNRNVYINKITDIVSRLKDQKRELTKNLREINNMRTSVELTKNTLRRVETAAENLIALEAQKKKKLQPIHKLFSELKEAYQGLVQAVEQQFQFQDSIRDLRIKIDATYSRNANRNIQQLQRDLEELKLESSG